MPDKIQFPDGFVWGVATSSYQIEGAWDEDAKGESIWDRFTHTPGNIEDGSTGDVACDHYHLWQEDIALMKSLNIQSYRFSISWPRILPTGEGSINQAGLDFYSKLVDGLLEAGIQPAVTLYHWDLPQAMYEEYGGWESRRSVEAFVNYADVVSRHLGDRVKMWITHNEPWVIAFLGYEHGEHAPGLVNAWHKAIPVSHHVMLSHGRAVPVIRANSPGSTVGITLDHSPVYPASESEADRKAARIYDGYHNRWFLDPLFGREYPADIVSHYTEKGYINGLDGLVLDGDYDDMSVPIDFLGINYYTRKVIRDEQAEDNLPISLQKNEEHTTMGWEIYPEGLYEFLCRMHFDYSPKAIYITENGAAYPTAPDADGRVRDEKRLDFLRQHLTAAHRAIQAGVPLKGYYQWSLMDNFEWGHGYLQRFGIVYVDYESRERIPKDSALWYRDVITNNGF